MRLLHRDVKLDCRSKSTGNLEIEISLFSYLPYYTVSLTRELRQNQSTTLLRIFYDKNLFRNLKSKLTAHTRPTPEYLAALQPYVLFMPIKSTEMSIADLKKK